MFDPELFGQAMAETIQKAVAPLREEVADLRKKLAETKSVEDVVRQAVVDEVAKLPEPKKPDEDAIAERVTQAIKGDLEGWKKEAESNIKPPELPDIRGMVDSAVSEAVKAIPVPNDGKDITIEDVQPLINEEIGRLRSSADECFKDVLAQAEQASDALIEAHANLRQPEDGKSVTLDDVRPVLDEAIEEIRSAAEEKIGTAVASAERAVAAAEEKAQSLRQPEDGKSITLDDVAPLIGAAVDDLRDQVEAVLREMEAATEETKKATKDAVEKAAALRQPEDGKSVTVEEVRPIIEDQIKQAVSAIPTPKDGVGLAGMLIDRDGSLVATMTNGEAKNLGPVVGKDGVSLDEFELEYLPDTHEVRITAQAGGARKSVTYPAGGIHGKGYWRDGLEAKAGEAWVQGGSLWIAKQNTTESPSHSSDKWFMAARKGRDGESVVRRVQSGPAQPIRLKEASDEPGND